jgi:hypothetical protein
MNISIKLVDSDSEIYKKILNGLLPQVVKYMDSAVRDIKPKIIPIIELAIRNSPEYESILIGQLRYELGIPNPSINLEGLIKIWIDSAEFTYNSPRISNNKIRSSFSIKMIKGDFSDVLSSDFSKVVDTVRGYDLPWLKWLLLDGTKTIVQDYEVLFGQNNVSRTGFAIMTPSKRSWKVPATYSGTVTNNWITRAIDVVSPDIEQILDRTFKL